MDVFKTVTLHYLDGTTQRARIAADALREKVILNFGGRYFPARVSSHLHEHEVWELTNR